MHGVSLDTSSGFHMPRFKVGVLPALQSTQLNFRPHTYANCGLGIPVEEILRSCRFGWQPSPDYNPTLCIEGLPGNDHDTLTLWVFE